MRVRRVLLRLIGGHLPPVLRIARNAARLCGVRNPRGKLITEVGDHAAFWQKEGTTRSTDPQVHVPIRSGEEKWGQIELRFESLETDGWMGQLQHPATQLIAFAAAMTFQALRIYINDEMGELETLDPDGGVADNSDLDDIDNIADINANSFVLVLLLQFLLLPQMHGLMPGAIAGLGECLLASWESAWEWFLSRVCPFMSG